MIYQWKPGSRYSVSAQAAGEQCKALADEGNLSAKSLVDANRPENAPLHAVFEWRDSVAAECYREDQARHVMRSIVTIAPNPQQGNQKTVRAFFHIEAGASPEYKEIGVIMRNESDAAALLKDAYRDAQAFAEKYHCLRGIMGEEMTGVLSAIDRLLSGHGDETL